MATLKQQIGKVSKWPSPGADSSSRLALELAMNIKNAQQICSEYDLPPNELRYRLNHDKQFRLQVAEYRQIWSHPTNAKERVQIKTATMVEDSLTDIWQILTNPDNNPAIRIDAHKHLSRLADVEPKKDGVDQGSRFSVTINLPGAEPMQVVADAAVDALEAA